MAHPPSRTRSISRDEAPRPEEQARGPVKGRGTVWAIEHRYSRQAQRELRRRLGHARAGRDARSGCAPETHGHRGARQVDPLRQRLARHPLRPVDQPLPRLRARLHLLLRAADAQLPQPVARARLRDPHHRQGQRRRAAARGLRAAAPTSRRCSTSARPPTPTSRSSAGCGITRAVIEVLAECAASVLARHQVVGHRARPRPDRADGARSGLAAVYVSVTSLDPALARILEPRAAAPHRRLRTIETLARAGVPVGVSVSPVIPFINEPELERVLEAAARGRRDARPSASCCACRGR